METPFKFILKALGIVLLAAVLLKGVPALVSHFGSAEWQLAIITTVLLAVSMLTQIYTNASKILQVSKNKSKH